MPLCLQCVWWVCDVPFWQGRQLCGWFSQSIAGCLSIAAFTFSFPANSTPCFSSSGAAAGGFLNRCYTSSIAAPKNPPLAILAIFRARHMSNCSSCTQLPCLARVEKILKTYTELIAASTYGIWLLPPPCILPWNCLRWLKPVSSTVVATYHWIRLQTSETWQHHNIQFCGLFGHMPAFTKKVSQYGQLKICHATLNVHQLYNILLRDGCPPQCGYTHIQLRTASYCCWIVFYRPVLPVRPGLCFWRLYLQRRSVKRAVCNVVLSQQVAYWMKHPSLCSILIHLYHAVLCVKR